MLKIIVAIVVAMSFAGLDVAGAATKKKKQQVRASAPVSHVAPANLRTPGPPWANPNDCYTDEGYGRYLRCGGGMDM